MMASEERVKPEYPAKKLLRKRRDQGRIQEFFPRGGCNESARQTFQGQRNGGGGGRGLMFKYVDFLHFDFRGINLSNLRH